MRKLNMCGTIIAALVSGLIISGYKCADIRDVRYDNNREIILYAEKNKTCVDKAECEDNNNHSNIYCEDNKNLSQYDDDYMNYADTEQDYDKNDDWQDNSNQSNINQSKKDFLIITWEDDNDVIDKLASLTNADIYKPQLSSDYVRIYPDIDMDEYSTYIVNLSSGSANSINILEQMADEYYLDGKTIIPLYDSQTSMAETINELEDRTKCSVWLTGCTLEKNADNEQVENWIKSLGIFIDL